MATIVKQLPESMKDSPVLQKLREKVVEAAAKRDAATDRTTTTVRTATVRATATAKAPTQPQPPTKPEPPAITIGLTTKEKQDVARALADKSMCQGTLQTYYTPQTFKVTLKDGSKIYVTALTDKGAESKADEAGYNVQRVARYFVPATTGAAYRPPADTKVDDEPRIVTAGRDQPEPSVPQAPALKAVTMREYEYKLPSGAVKTFEAVNEDEAKDYVNRVGGLVSTLKQTGAREMSEYEIRDILSSSAKAGAMDYARVLVKYGQVEGDVIPVREGDTRQVFFVDKDQWESLPAEYKKIVTQGSFDDLTDKIVRSMPETYRDYANKFGAEAAIAKYTADMERVNEIVDGLKPYKEGDGYDLTKILQDKAATADDLKLVGFNAKDVNNAADYVDKLGGILSKWDRAMASSYVQLAGTAIIGAEPMKAGTAADRQVLTQAEYNDLVSAFKDAGLFQKYKVGDWVTEMTGAVSTAQLREAWASMTDEDRWRVAERYAGYPAGASMLSSTFRGLVTIAPKQAPAVKFLQTLGTGAIAGVMAPFAKEQAKDEALAKLDKYKVDGGYDITKYVKSNPYDATLLANAGISAQAIVNAQDGQKVVATPQGANAKDWAVAGLIVAAMGTGGAGVLIGGSSKAGAALMVASGTAQLGLGGIATVDTVTNWHSMDSTERGIAVAFDVMLIAAGLLSARGGYKALTTTQRRNIHLTWRRGKKVIIENYPFASRAKVGSLLDRISVAIQTNNRQMLVRAAEQLQGQSQKLRGSVKTAMIDKTKLLQAAPDDYVGLGRAIPAKRALVVFRGQLVRGRPATGKGAAAGDILGALRVADNELRAVERALRRTTSRNRYNTLTKVQAALQRQREQLTKQTATKTATLEDLLQKVKVPDKVIPKTRALAKIPTKALTKVPDKIIVGTKKVPIPVKEVTKTKLGTVSKRYGVSIWDITRETRKLPKGVQEEIAIINPVWQPLIIAVTTKTATKVASKLSPAVRQKLYQRPKPAPQPRPQPQPQPQPELSPQKLKQEVVEPVEREKVKPKEREPVRLDVWPYQHQAQQIKQLYKRKLKTPVAEGELPKTRKAAQRLGIQTWKQGLFYISGFPPFRTTGKDKDYVYSRKRPPWGVVGHGKGSPQATLRIRGGKVPRLSVLPMGVFSAEVGAGRTLTYRRRKGRGSRIIRGDI